jgi:hypothetical protein
MNDPNKIGGVIVRADGALRFVPASVAIRVAPPPRITPVPGAPPELVGVAMYEGAILPVVAIGSARGEMIVCQHATEVIGLVGAEVLSTGTFEVAAGSEDRVLLKGEGVETLDVAAIYARVQANARPGRWGT